MRRSGWKTALPVFLLGATLSTAVYAAGGLGVDGLGQAVPEIAPVPYVSPFAVVDGVDVAVVVPDAVAEQSLPAFNRIPQPPSRAADTPPRPRPVKIAGETVPIDPPDAVDEVQPRARRPRRDADRDDDRSRGRRDDDVTPDAAPTPEPAPADKHQDKPQPGKADEPGKPNDTPKDEGDGEATDKESRGPGDEDDKRVHTASDDGDAQDDDADEAGRGEGRDNGDDGGNGDGGDVKQSKSSGGDDAKPRRS